MCLGGRRVLYLQLVVLAVAPAIFLLVYLYYRDRYEREPHGLVVRTFFFGALMAVPVVAVNLAVLQPLAELLGIAGSWKAPWEAFISAALVEEFFKLVAVYLVAYRNPNFNEPYDGIVYAAAASLGFAALENVLYVIEGGMSTGFVRAILSVPGHAIWGIMMGYYLGKAKFTGPGWGKVVSWLAALALPVLLHGLFDLFNLVHYEIAFYLLFPLFAYMWYRAVEGIRDSHRVSPFAPPVARPGFGGPCGGCGATLVSGANFCHHCGLPVQGRRAADTAQ